MKIQEKYKLVTCGREYADAALTMLREIRVELVQAGREELYCMEESDEEFRAFFSNPQTAVWGAVTSSTNILAAVGAVSFNSRETELFSSFLPPDLTLDQIGYVDFIQVARPYRGAGLQRLLFQKIEEYSVERGARLLTGVVSPKNSHSLVNFLGMGYRTVGSIRLKNGFLRLVAFKFLSDVPCGYSSKSSGE